MSVTTTRDKRLTRSQSAQMPALLEFYSPSAALLETRPQPMARGIIWTVCSMFVACALAAGLIPIDKVVTAPGKVVATQDTIVVQPLETSIVRELLVNEGQIVHKGDLLARLDPTFSTSDKTALAQSVASLRAEVERRRAEAAGIEYHPSTSDPASQVQEAIFAQRRAERTYRLENYKQKIDSLTSTLAKAQGDIKAFGARLQVATIVEGKRRELESLGVGSTLTRLQSQDARLDVERGLNEATQTARSADNDLRAMRAEASAYDQNWKTQNAGDLIDATRKMDDAQGNLTKAEMRSQLVEFRAGLDATVLMRAPVSVGSVLQSGDQLFKLSPIGAPMEVDATVVGSEAGYVHVGDEVMIKFDTFPFTQYGAAKGVVRIVSPDSFTGSQRSDQVMRGTTPSGQTPQPGQAYYALKISIDSINLHDTPRGFHVQPGMPITADVLVGERTVLDYIFSRALPVVSEGMREP